MEEDLSLTLWRSRACTRKQTRITMHNKIIQDHSLRKSSKGEGFTLIEFAVVLGVLALIVVLGLPVGL